MCARHIHLPSGHERGAYKELPTRNRLQKLTLRGFKTIRDLEDFEPGALTVLIGPNGAGKSNFFSFFRMLSWALASPGDLQFRVAELGGASALLHDGPRVTREIEAHLTIVTDAGDNEYAFRLVYAAADTLIYRDEKYRSSRRDLPGWADWMGLDAGHLESRLMDAASDDPTAKTILILLRRIIVYQFHNTSATARMRGKWDVEDSWSLKEDGANIAPFLYRLHNDDPKSYQRIVETLRLILPFFADFEFEPIYGKLLLRWREKGCDRVFNASQAADGMLRAMAIVTDRPRSSDKWSYD